ncbi:hypothetical protein E4U50_002435, partial [Claviceps purpurea]
MVSMGFWRKAVLTGMRATSHKTRGVTKARASPTILAGNRQQQWASRHGKLASGGRHKPPRSGYQYKIRTPENSRQRKSQ